jgi:hypothetical protein
MRDLCVTCGIPADSEYFDESGFAPVPEAGSEVLLARFDLRHQYCGVMEWFSQFTDAFGRDPSAVETPGLEWLLLVNRRPLSPYVGLQAIVNPWGSSAFAVRIRLPEAAKVEFLVRNTGAPPNSAVKRVGGRLAGRYWFNRV